MRIGEWQSLLAVFAVCGLTACVDAETDDQQPPDAAEQSLLPINGFAALVAPLGSLEGRWAFDERTGTTANDQSGFGRHATLSGGATFSTTDRPVIDDNRSSLSIIRTATAVATAPASTAFDLLGSFSVMFWTNVPAGLATHFIGVRATGCGAITWEIAQNRANLLYFAGPGGQIRSFGSRLTPNTWTLVGVTYSAGTMRLYLNGIQVASGAYTPGSVSNRALMMGHVGECTGRAALLDEVLIYSRALTATEVASLGTVPPAPTNLTIASRLSTAMNLTWTPVSGVELHTIEKGTAAGNEVFYTHSAATPTFHADHLTPNTQYSWRVRTVKNGLYSSPSVEVIGSTNAGPSAPGTISATLVTSDRIQVAWGAVGSAVKYYVFRSTNGGPFAFTGSAVAPVTTWLSANLLPATTYAFRVQAEDAGQTISGMSSSASATTP